MYSLTKKKENLEIALSSAITSHQPHKVVKQLQPENSWAVFHIWKHNQYLQITNEINAI